MWNVIASNRILDRKMKQHSYQKHKLALNQMKGLIDNSCPPTYNFLFTQPKKRQLLYQQERDINHDNTHLLRRMMTTKSACSSKDNSLRLKESLHWDFNKKMTSEIDSSNKKFITRLRSASSQYSKDKLQKMQKEYLRRKNHLNSTQMDPYYNFHSATSTKQSRPFSAKC